MQQHTIDLSQLLRTLWKYSGHIALLVAVAAVSAFAVTARQPVYYAATSTVMVENQQPKLALPAGLEITYLQDVGSQLEIMRSNSVIERAIIQLEPDRAGDSSYLQTTANRIRDIMRITQVKGTNIVAISITELDPQVAVREANAVAEAFVFEAKQSRLAAVENSLEKTNIQMKELAGAKLDVSIDPTAAKLSSDIKVVLAVLETATRELDMSNVQNTSISSANVSSSASADSLLSWPILQTLPPQLNQMRADIAGLRSGLPLLTSGEVPIGAIESSARKLGTDIAVLKPQIEGIKKTGTNQELDDKVSDAQEIIRSAEQDWTAVIQQITALYDVRTDYNVDTVEDPARFTDSVNRLNMRVALVGAQLKVLSGKIGGMEKSLIAFNESQLKLANQAAVSTQDTLRGILAGIQPTAPDQSLFVTYDELSDMENRARIAGGTLASAQAILKTVTTGSLSPATSARLTAAATSLNTAAEAVRKMPDTVFDISSSGQSNLSFSALNSLRQELQLSLVTNEGGGIRVVDAATVSAPDTGIFGKYLNVVLAGIAALLLSVFGILLMLYFDTRVRYASQVTESLGLPILAHISPVARNRSRLPPTILEKSADGFLESFRILRTNLRLDSQKGKVLLISSPQEKEGKTTVAVNLARAAALQGQKTLLIDADFVSLRPGIPRNFSLVATSGLAPDKDQPKPVDVDKAGSIAVVPSLPSSLTELVSHHDGLWGYAAQEDNVDVLSLEKDPNSLEITSSGKMNDFMLRAKAIYDVIVIDSSPVLGNADTAILARQADDILLVLRKDHSRLDLAKESKTNLESIGARVAGLVFIE